MKRFFTIAILFYSIATGERTDLTSVFKIYPLARLYQAARERTPLQPLVAESNDNDKNTKRTICENIFSSEFFVRYEEFDLVDQRKTLNDVKKKSVYFMNEWRRKVKGDTSEYSSHHIELDETTAIYEFGDPEFHVANEVVFVCLGWSLTEEKVFPFYISREYNMSELIDTDDESEQYAAGRFIFQGSLKNLNLLAIAEEPAKFHSSPSFDLERYYAFFIKRNRPADAWDDKDAFCNKLDRTRLCKSVFSSSHYRNIYSLPPSYPPVDCVKNIVQFQAKDVTVEVGEQIFYEWATYCDVWETNVRTRFYIFRGYHPHHVFVSVGGENRASYELSPEGVKVYLKGLFLNVSVYVR